MARPRSFDETRVLHRIKDTFWQKGYQATSLDELIQATGLGKGSLYAAFGDKNNMYCLALALYEKEEVATGLEALANRPGERPEAAIGRLLSFAVRPIVEDRDYRGCFLCNASSEVDQLSPEGADIVRRSHAALLSAIQDALVGADDQPLAAAAARERAHGIFAVYFGMRIMARAGMPAEALDSARQSALASLTVY